jgi:hypothetical protein
MVVNADYKINHKSIDADLEKFENKTPIWRIGDSWKYNVKSVNKFNFDDYFELNVEDLLFTVIDDVSDLYKVGFEGNVTGGFNYFPFSKLYYQGKINGYEMINKSSLEISKIIANIYSTTTLPWIGKTSATIGVSITFDPGFTCISFPLYVGKSWTRPSTHVSVDYNINLLQSTTSKHYEHLIPGRTLVCTAKESIIVEACKYEAFKICDNFGLVETYYDTTVGNIVKIHGSDPDNFINLNMELVSTNYSPPESPGKPNKPTGPVVGDPGEIYSFCSQATDPENDQLFYWFDWGDDTNSGWLGPYDSEKTVCADHIWIENGFYLVRVKAKDINGNQGPWSDSSIINVGKEEDNQEPYVEITKPQEHSIYINNIKIGALFMPLKTIIIGNLEIKVEASDKQSGIDRVEFLINGIIKKTDSTEPYLCKFDESSGTHTIEVVAYDGACNSANDSTTVIKLF